MSRPDPDEVDVVEVARLIWRGRVWVAASAVLFAVLGVVYALVAREWFVAKVVMTPVVSQTVSGGLGQLGGLASLVGMDFGNMDDGRGALAVLRSRDFAMEFVEQKQLSSELIRISRWPVLEKFGNAGSHDIRDAVAFFDSKVRSVGEDKKTGLVTLTISWPDAETAASLANSMVTKVNEHLRNRAIAEAQRNVDYLEGLARSVAIAPVQQSIARVLESEIQKLMLAKGKDEYAFKVVDSAFPPKRKSQPKRALIVGAAGIFGVFVAIAGLLLRNTQSQGRTPADTRGSASAGSR